MKFVKKLKIVSKKNFIVELYIMKKYLKAKIKSYNGNIIKNFRNNKILKKSVVKDEKMREYITDDIDISSDDSVKKGSDEENSDKENSDEENLNEEN